MSLIEHVYSPLEDFNALRLLRILTVFRKTVLMQTLIDSFEGLSGIMGLLAYSFVIFSILGIHIWKGSIHNRCYTTVEPEWKLLDNYPHLCSNFSQCPEGAICAARESY
jgi:hypothetical protein